MKKKYVKIMAVIVLLEISVSFGGIVDQSNLPTWTGGWVNIVPANEVSQTFATGLPYLTGVDVDIVTGNTGRGGDTITAKILRGDEILWAASQFLGEGFDGLLHFELDNPIETIDGETLSLILSDTGKVVFGWKYGSNTYYGGMRYFNGESRPSHDHYFQTYGIVPEPATMLLILGALPLLRRKV